jgi:hypothetical protein
MSKVVRAGAPRPAHGTQNSKTGCAAAFRSAISIVPNGTASPVIQFPALRLRPTGADSRKTNHLGQAHSLILPKKTLKLSALVQWGFWASESPNSRPVEAFQGPCSFPHFLAFLSSKLEYLIVFQVWKTPGGLILAPDRGAVGRGSRYGVSCSPGPFQNSGKVFGKPRA